MTTKMTDDTVPEQHTTRYEKNIEMRLGLWVQQQHVLAAIATARAAFETPAGYSSAVAKAIDAAVVDAMARPRYVQMAGKLETALGDGIAAFDASFVLLECKIRVPASPDDWKREALSKTEIKNGKGRQKTFATFKAKYNRIHALSADCHFLLGQRDDGSLGCQPYVEFLAQQQNISDIDVLLDKGLALNKFASYVAALLRLGQSGDDDSDWLLAEIIVLARASGKLAACSLTLGELKASLQRLLAARNVIPPQQGGTTITTSRKKK